MIEIERVRKLKDYEGISFKFIAEECDINYGKFRKFITGRSGLRDDEEEILDLFLQDHGV